MDPTDSASHHGRTVERRIVVMRHAKSSWKSGEQSDHQRPLNGRGRRSAPVVATRLSDLGWQPQHVLSSDAVRTSETAQLMLPCWEEGIGVDFVNNLYLAGPLELKLELCAISDEIETLLVLGHNPGWESVVHRLTGIGVTMKTASAALLQTPECECWSDTFESTWTLEELLHPRELEFE